MPETLETGEIKLNEKQKLYLEDGDFFGTFSEELKDIFAVYGLESADNLDDVTFKLNQLLDVDDLENPTDEEAFKEAFDKIGLYKTVYDMEGISYNAEKAYKEYGNSEAIKKSISTKAAKDIYHPTSPPDPFEYNLELDYDEPAFEQHESETYEGYLDRYDKYLDSYEEWLIGIKPLNDNYDQPNSRMKVEPSRVFDDPESESYERGERTVVRGNEKISYTDYLQTVVKNIENFGENILELKPPLGLREYRLIKKVCHEQDVKIGVVIEEPKEEISNKQFVKEMIRILQLQKAEETSK